VIAGANGAGGKSELQRAGCRITPGGGNPKESATEIKPPPLLAVRVKRRGKSSPVPMVTWESGKPHPEQDQIGKRLRMARPMLPGWLLEIASNCSPRGMITAR
jgi:hypothetical protein